MKIVGWIIILAIGWGCNTSSADKIVEEDSLQYFTPPPGVLSQKEFRYYHTKLSNFFENKLLRRGFNGGILVAKNGAIIYEKYAGFSDLRSKDTLTDSTPVHIASAGKTFTGMAVLKMVQENKLSLNDSLQKFFPGLPYPGVTVKMLLSHRSGLPNYVYFIPNSKWDQKQYVTNADVLNLLYTEQPKRIFAPGTRFTYSNTNYVLLAMIIEKISGQPFAEYMQQKFFGPLKMDHTYVFTLQDSLTATPSFAANNRFWENDFLEHTYGDKNIYSTPRDLLKWDQALYTDQLLSKTLLDSAFTPYSFEKPSIHNYGLGWRLLMIPNGKKVIYHNGKWHGFNAAFARLTDEKVTIIILGNKYNSNIYTAARKAYDIFGEYKQTRGGGGNDADLENDSPMKAASSSAKKAKNKR
jgi:CubicO group peptidase (beta-lactamase class C family)